MPRRRGKAGSRAKPELAADVESTRRSTSLPSGVFRSRNPDVEAELAASVSTLFLRHMASEGVPETRTEPIPHVAPRNKVSSADLDAFIADLKSRPPAPCPDLCTDLETERLWILADMATNGGGVSRLLATTELRDRIGRLDRDHAISTDTLRELVQMIRKARERRGISVLLHVLMLAASEALKRREVVSE